MAAVTNPTRATQYDWGKRVNKYEYYVTMKNVTLHTRHSTFQVQTQKTQLAFTKDAVEKVKESIEKQEKARAEQIARPLPRSDSTPKPAAQSDWLDEIPDGLVKVEDDGFDQAVKDLAAKASDPKTLAGIIAGKAGSAAEVIENVLIINQKDFFSPAQYEALLKEAANRGISVRTILDDDDEEEIEDVEPLPKWLEDHVKGKAAGCVHISDNALVVNDKSAFSEAELETLEGLAFENGLFCTTKEESSFW